MKTTTGYWRNWWNERAKAGGSDFEADRGSGLMVGAVEDRRRARLIEVLRPNPADLILDAGCGTGDKAIFLAPHARRVVAADFSEEMIGRAAARVNEAELANVELLVGDVTRLPFEDAAFDKVVCASVLQYLDDSECQTAIRELLRVCKPGATLVFHVKNSRSLYGLSLALWRAVARCLGRRPRPSEFRSWRRYRRFIHDAGGTVLEFDSFGCTTFVGCPRRLVRLLLELEPRLFPARLTRKLGVNLEIVVRV